MKSKKQKYSKLIITAAKNTGVPPEKYYKEIEKAMEESRKSSLPSAKEFWSAYPEGYQPTPEEFILRLTRMTQEKLKKQ